jgi:hypothetical protein
MRRVSVVAILAIAVCGPLWANPMVSNAYSDPVGIQSPNSLAEIGGTELTPREWLAKLRRQCKSDESSDQIACDHGLAALKKGHAELLARRAAQRVVAD